MYITIVDRAAPRQRSPVVSGRGPGGGEGARIELVAINAAPWRDWKGAPPIFRGRPRGR